MKFHENNFRRHLFHTQVYLHKSIMTVMDSIGMATGVFYVQGAHICPQRKGRHIFRFPPYIKVILTQ